MELVLLFCEIGLTVLWEWVGLGEIGLTVLWEWEGLGGIGLTVLWEWVELVGGTVCRTGGWD